MDALKVETAHAAYPILFESSFERLADSIAAIGKDYSRIGIITDETVASIYLGQLEAALSPLQKPVHHHAFAPGEKSKHFQTMNGIYDFLIEKKFDRKSLVVALGGGVAGDMAGYAAATYMRGIDFIQVPTTLLAQVDSSIGGKTGIDHRGYKNIVGAFYQPQLVYINTATLATLPEREFRAGMAEVVKHGLIRSEPYLAFLEQDAAGIKSLKHEAIAAMVRQSCEIKAAVVSADEKEAGLRAILNFGHTIGHAIERLKELELLHGECVSIGMAAAIAICEKEGTLSSAEAQRAKAAISLFGLPMKVQDLDSETVYKELFHDKKTQHNRLSFVLLEGIGSCRIDNGLDKESILAGIEAIIETGGRA